MKVRYVALLLTGLLLLYPIYFWFTYIDETVTSGEKYGLIIGSSKLDVYNALPKALGVIKRHGDSVFIQIKVSNDTAVDLATKSDFNVLVESRFHDIGFTSFEKLDAWAFYVNASYFNSLKLQFCDGKLCKIHRHRQYFELP